VTLVIVTYESPGETYIPRSQPVAFMVVFEIV